MIQSRIRLTAAYKYEDRKNDVLYGGEYAKIQSYGIDGKWNMKNNSAINAKFTYTSISYDGVLKTSKAFVMLDALQNGNNWIWNLNWNIRLSRGIELTLDYDGRKPAEEKIIHTGRMSIRALL